MIAASYLYTRHQWHPFDYWTALKNFWNLIRSETAGLYLIRALASGKHDHKEMDGASHRPNMKLTIFHDLQGIVCGKGRNPILQAHTLPIATASLSTNVARI